MTSWPRTCPPRTSRPGWPSTPTRWSRRSATGPDLVVVAHSLGGFVAPLVCERLAVDLLVLVTAMVPLPGERGQDWWANTGHAEALGGHRNDDEMALYLHDVPPGLAAEALARGRDQTMTPMREPWPPKAWPEVPTRFLLCRDDRWHPPPWMRGLVRERLGIEADEIDGGHCPYLSRPRELAERLEAYWVASAATSKERAWDSR